MKDVQVANGNLDFFYLNFIGIAKFQYKEKRNEFWS